MKNVKVKELRIIIDGDNIQLVENKLVIASLSEEELEKYTLLGISKDDIPYILDVFDNDVYWNKTYNPNIRTVTVIKNDNLYRTNDNGTIRLIGNVDFPKSKAKLDKPFLYLTEKLTRD